MSSAKRRQPRKSSLAKNDPIAPPREEERQPEKKGTQYAKKKVGFYQKPEDTERLRGAVLHGVSRGGPRTMSEFIDYAVMKEVSRQEEEWNNGEPFPAVGAGDLPQGRPLGATSD